MKETILGVECTPVDDNTYRVDLVNGKSITIRTNVEHNGVEWEYEVNGQLFGKWEYACRYLTTTIQEKMTGLRFVLHTERTTPELCGDTCRHPGECNRALCSRCPVAIQHFADRDGVKVVYATK